MPRPIQTAFSALNDAQSPAPPASHRHRAALDAPFPFSCRHFPYTTATSSARALPSFSLLVSCRRCYRQPHAVPMSNFKWLTKRRALAQHVVATTKCPSTPPPQASMSGRCKGRKGIEMGGFSRQYKALRDNTLDITKSAIHRRGLRGCGLEVDIDAVRRCRLQAGFWESPSVVLRSRWRLSSTVRWWIASGCGRRKSLESR